MRALLATAISGPLFFGCGGREPAPTTTDDGSLGPPPEPPSFVTSAVPAGSTPIASAAPIASASSTVPPEVPPAGFVPIPEKRKGGFPGVAFTEVRAVAFDLTSAERGQCGMPLDDDGTLCDSVERPGVALSPEQTKKLLGLVGDRRTYGSGSKCFLPHHGFVFYDDKGVPVAEISLCFMCHMGASLPAIPAAGKSEAGGSFGLSEKGTAELRGLCRDLGLPMCDAQRPDEFSAPRP